MFSKLYAENGDEEIIKQPVFALSILKIGSFNQVTKIAEMWINVKF